MNSRTELSNDQWEILQQRLLLHGRVYVGYIETCHRFLNAVLWILRSGRNGVFCRNHWANGIRFLNTFRVGVNMRSGSFCMRVAVQYPDMQQVPIDSAIRRAHACAA